jgi:hypothetical protein
MVGASSKLFFQWVGFSALILWSSVAFSQRPVRIDDAVSQYIFSFSEIEYLEDPTGILDIANRIF